MFSYFGGKSKVVHLYPSPEYGLIIEPFCGSARYSCVHGLDKDVWLNDAYPVIYRIWKWLIQATVKDVMSLPNLTKGDDVRSIKSLSG